MMWLCSARLNCSAKLALPVSEQVCAFTITTPSQEITPAKLMSKALQKRVKSMMQGSHSSRSYKGATMSSITVHHPHHRYLKSGTERVVYVEQIDTATLR
jgi:hypothetical protein